MKIKILCAFLLSCVLHLSVTNTASADQAAKFHCTVCKRIFDTNHGFNQHRVKKEHVSDQDETRLPCIYCQNTSCATVRTLFWHMCHTEACSTQQEARYSNPVHPSIREYVAAFRAGSFGEYPYNLCQNCGRACVKSKNEHVDCNPKN